MTEGILLGKVPPVQAAVEALEHYKRRAEVCTDSLPKAMAELICQLSGVAESEDLDFRAILTYATALKRSENLRAYEGLKQAGVIQLPGGAR